MTDTTLEAPQSTARADSRASDDLRRLAPWTLAAAVLFKALLYASAFLYMVVYSYALRPGLELEAYRAHAAVASPWVALVAGPALLWAFARWLGRRYPGRWPLAPLALWGLQLLFDLPLLFGMTGRDLLLCGVAQALLLAAALHGGLTRSRPRR